MGSGGGAESGLPVPSLAGAAEQGTLRGAQVGPGRMAMPLARVAGASGALCTAFILDD